MQPGDGVGLPLHASPCDASEMRTARSRTRAKRDAFTSQEQKHVACRLQTYDSSLVPKLVVCHVVPGSGVGVLVIFLISPVRIKRGRLIAFTAASSTA
jgi:hypothetical protein